MSKLYEDFHKFPARRRTRAASSFRIPTRAAFVGPALYILYKSDKLDPITYAVPNAPINYIHEHKAGVKVYWCGDGEIEDTAVLPKIRNHQGDLDCLGGCLGLGYIDDEGEEIEVECDPRRVELYGIKLAPRRSALLVIQDKKKVSALIWGGKLDIEPRGIVG